MKLKNKLKELRMSRNMTQESVAEHLGVSSQTVSKWERGLLSPDISLLPKIALLFRCSIDSLFDMDLLWSVEHRQEFEAELQKLHDSKDWEGIYQTWIREIEMNPDNFGNYADVMLHVYRRKLYDEKHLLKLISLAEHAEKNCTDDDKRNEIYRIMIQVCSESDIPGIKEKSRYYYQKLPSLRHSREVFAKFVTDGAEYRNQVLKNIIYLTDLAECSVRQLIVPEMTPKEKLYYYQKAAALYEAVLDGKYAGFYDFPLLHDYCEIAKIYVRTEQPDFAENYINRVLASIEKHFSDNERNNPSALLFSTAPKNVTSAEQLYMSLLNEMLKTQEFRQFHRSIAEQKRKFDEFISLTEDKSKNAKLNQQ